MRSQVHCDFLESYYQEIGRAGRDREGATATLHYRAEDLGLRTFFASGAPDPDDLARVYTAISEAGSVKIRTLAATVGMAQRSVSRQVSLLEQARMVRSGSGGIRLTGEADAAAAASRALELAEERERIDQSRIAMMRSYAETRQCRRQFLLGYFGEELAGPCGNCDTCTAGTASDEESVAAAGDDEFPVDSVVSQAVGVRNGDQERR